MELIKQQNWLKLFSTFLAFIFYNTSFATTYFCKVAFISKPCELKNFSLDCVDQDIEREYIASITKQGFTVLYTSKWLNTVVFYSNTSLLPTSPYIKNATFLDSTSNNQILGEKPFITKVDPILTSISKNVDNINPTQFLNLTKLHALGFKGNGIKIMVLDGGFLNVNRLEAFKNPKIENQFLGLYDISANNKNAYMAGQHGTQVLSSIAANSPGYFVGTAPNISFAIATTETDAIESPIEEWAFIQMVEFATIQKFHILHASLGYTEFDNKNLNHTYNQFYDTTLPLYKVTKQAYNRGLIIVNSAGNSGDLKWKYIGFPSSSPYVISVGATSINKKFATFSSNGYTSKMLKPNVTSWGLNATIISGNGNVSVASGTSFSSPQIAGGLACVMEAIPNKSPNFYFNLLHSISSQTLTPDSLMGFGIPNFDAVLMYNIKSKFPFFSSTAWQDTMSSFKEIKTFYKINRKYKLKIKDSKGNTRFQSVFKPINSLISGTQIGSLPKGVYTICIKKGLKKWKKTFFHNQ